MTPHDLAADNSLLLRFQREVAYLDRTLPSDDEVQRDTEVLFSKDGVLVVAWLWPSQLYTSEVDPFADASRGNRKLWENAMGQSESVDAEEVFKSMTSALDRRRRSRRKNVASRFVRILETTARSVGRSVEDLKTHLQWSASVGELELDLLLDGYAPFSFSIIVRLGDALQLEFADPVWGLVDPQGLAQRIDQSVLASTISYNLRDLTLDNLKTVARRLPRPSVHPGQAKKLDVYRAPRPGGRYWSLYEALAVDARNDPDYTLAEIDRLLVDAGEKELPESAREDRSWWVGNRAKTARPQISAWLAAGYRIRDRDPSSGRVTVIGFEALPGRAEWLANPGRTLKREYQVPEPTKVGIYPDVEAVGIYPDVEAIKAVMKARLPELQAVLEALKLLHRSDLPDDPDIRYLDEFLYQLGEADRSQIEGHFNRVRDKPVDAAWMTNLLTKARRHGWTVNHGTRSRPRWASTRLTAALIEDIADNWKLETPATGTSGAVPGEFLQLVAKAVGVDSASSSGPQIARKILESSGSTWQPEFESADNSVTGLGLKAVRDAIGIPMPPETEIVVLG
jgi:hypothetical protein